MLELLLIAGLLFVLLIVGLLHYAATSNNPQVTVITGVSGDNSLHPWFFTVEAILFLAIMYIFKCWIS